MSIATTVHTPAIESTPQLKSIRARGTWTGALRTDIEVGSFSFTTGEPIALGGDSSAPTPMDYVVGGFLGCLTALIELVARERGIDIAVIRHAATAKFDRRGFAGLADVSPAITSLEATVWVEATALSDEFAELIDQVEKRCPAYNLFHQAGCTPEVTWLLNGAEVSA